MQQLSFAGARLFTPADRPDRFAHRVSVGAEGAIPDWEDGVGLCVKETARRAVSSFLAAPAASPTGSPLSLRRNHVTTADGLRDLIAPRDTPARPKLGVAPKTEPVTAVEIALARLAAGLGERLRIVAFIKSGRLSTADAVATLARSTRSVSAREVRRPHGRSCSCARPPALQIEPWE